MLKFTNDKNTPSSRRCCFSCCKNVLCTMMIFLLLFGVLIACLTVKAYLLTSGFSRIILDPNPTYLNLSDDEIKNQSQRLSGAIRIPTVSTHNKKKRPDYLKAIQDLHLYITINYPLIHQSKFVDKTVVANYSLIYRVQGTSSSPLNKSVYMLCGHLDVATTPKRASWHFDPFSGEPKKCSYCDRAFDFCKDFDDNYIYGRGAIDTKNVVFGILEALENLLKRNQQPIRTFYIAFSHDEEIGGMEGSVAIKEQINGLLQKHEEKLDFILDEGTVVAKDYYSFIKDPLIYISVVEVGSGKLKFRMDPNTNPSHVDDYDLMLHSNFDSGDDNFNTSFITNSTFNSSDDYNNAYIDYIDKLNKSRAQERCERSWKLKNALKKIIYQKSQLPFRYGDGPEFDTWNYLSLYMDHFIYKLLASNMWLFKVLISSGLVNSKQVKISLLLIIIIRKENEYDYIDKHINSIKYV